MWRASAAALVIVWAAEVQQSSRHAFAAAPGDEVRAPARLIDTGLYALNRPGVIDDEEPRRRTPGVAGEQRARYESSTNRQPEREDTFSAWISPDELRQLP